ncbi:hypothetical protein [Pseudoduganella sp. UC29_71]|uniref:hypothetical protein n=1 Tax=Pseudoduganella sp. UC29_71 TaxID=3350174 RepID=UPI00366CABEE
MSPVHLYHIAYSPETLASVPPGFSVLDNMSGLRNDWREYWPMRTFLLRETLDPEAYYGFFSPRFQEKTGLDAGKVTAFVHAAGGADVVAFSPQVDMGAFFLNIFEQEELFQPGFSALSQEFVQRVGLQADLATLVMDSRHIIFSNYFVAKPAFWRAWLDLNEQLFALCERGPADDALRAGLTDATTYPGAVQRKVFLMERIASLLLAIDARWTCKAYNPFGLAWSASRLNQFRLEAILSDALKMAIREQGYAEYYEAFSAMRDKLR